MSGIKRHIAVDTNGFPHAIHVTTANISDKAGAIEMFDHDQAFLPNVKNILCDGSYIGQPFAGKIRNILDCPVEIVKRSSENFPQVKQMVVLAFLGILIRAC
ncbi:MAG: transposase [Streptococcaceae bacterium]|nr:transposase [Streptococcaceae bacterium]